MGLAVNEGFGYERRVATFAQVKVERNEDRPSAFVASKTLRSEELHWHDSMEPASSGQSIILWQCT